MSYSLVTLLLVVAFMSAIPNASSAAYAKGTDEYTKVQQFVAKEAEFNQLCTDLKADTKNGLAGRIQLSDATAFSNAAALENIKETIPTLFTSATDPDDDEKIKIHSAVALVVFPRQQCGIREPTNNAAAKLLLRAKIIERVMNVVAAGTWPDKSIKSACLIIGILSQFDKTFANGVTDVDIAAVTRINTAVSYATTKHTIGSAEFIPDVNLITNTYKLVQTHKPITDYIGAASAENHAKLCQVLCYISEKLFKNLNPEFQPGDVEKISDFIWNKYQFPPKCVMPGPTDFEALSKQISGDGKILSGKLQWRVRAQLGNIFKKPAVLRGDDVIKSHVAASIFAHKGYTCGDITKILTAGDDKGLRWLAFDLIKLSCPGRDCGDKALGYLCQIYHRLDQIHTARKTSIAPMKNFEVVILAALKKIHPPIYADGGAVPFDKLAKAVKIVGVDKTISDWLADDPVKYACLVRAVESAVITSTPISKDPPVINDGRCAGEKNDTAAAATTTTPKDGSALPSSSTFEIVGIVIGVLILIGVIAFAGWYILKHKS